MKVSGVSQMIIERLEKLQQNQHNLHIQQANKHQRATNVKQLLNT